MIVNIVFVVSVLLTLILGGLQRAYSLTSPKELSRLSREGDQRARRLHLVAKYHGDISWVFWPAILFFCAMSIWLASHLFAPGVAVAGIIVLLILTFIYTPYAKIPKIFINFAAKVAPKVARTIAFVEPAVKKVQPIASRLVSHEVSVLNEDELLEILKEQQETPGHRINSTEISMMVELLRNNEEPIGKFIVPLESTKIVSVDESIGPILINELHQTKQQYFPVREAKKKNIIGTFYIGDLLDQSDGGKVKEVMTEHLFFINHKQPTRDLLDAFIKTKSHVYMVIDEKQKISGVVSIEDALAKLLGRSFKVEFDAYDSPDSVAEVLNPRQESSDKV